MQFVCPLIVVRDIGISRAFYEEVLGQKVGYDLGENVSFEGGFAIHLRSHFADLIGVDEDDIIRGSKNAELYFEEDDLDAFLERLKRMDSVRYVHGVIEQPWGQRAVRLYDPDMHIVEVGEPMESVVKRFLKSGLSVEETARRTSMPEEFVRQCVEAVRPDRV
ncbi:MAG: VOC family protein [Methanoculleus chikugoensis]|jgi:catechol 2,3-dioxygenase-like lactoylglutathione lyase family enzyme|nr:VOC family protein [Methanoculleus chikugoensis]